MGVCVFVCLWESLLSSKGVGYAVTAVWIEQRNGFGKAQFKGSPLPAKGLIANTRDRELTLEKYKNTQTAARRDESSA